MEAVETLGGKGDGGVESKSDDRLVEVVVDRLRYADDTESLFLEHGGDAERAVAADGNERVELLPAKSAHQLVGTIDLDELAAPLDGEAKGVADVGGPEDGAT